MPHKNKSDLKEEAYLYIRERIISGEYKPGDMISEKYLQVEIGVSRTPIREALFKLENDYFVNIYPRRGIFVSNITAKTIRDIYQARLFIEVSTLEVACDNISHEWLRNMREQFSNSPVGLSSEKEIKAYFVNLDWEFHSNIINICRNKVLTDIMANIWTHNQRMRILTYELDDRHDTSNDEHIQIIDALLNNDLNIAKDALKNHLNNAKAIALKYIELY